MVRIGKLAVLAGLLVASAASAQTTTWRFRWQPGQVLTYRVDQTTVAAEVLEGKKTESKSRMASIKRWKVLEVEAEGVATLQLSLDALVIETTTPGGEVMRFDSANPQSSNPQMREQLSRYVGQPLAVLRVNGQGKVVEVKESKHGPAAKYESEPPFVIVLPEGAPQKTWERAYKITLAPPQGTNEQFDAVQQYALRDVTDKAVTVALTSLLKTKPEAVADQVPLLQMQPEGEVVFNVQAGLLESARLRVDKELKGHQGEGSSYHFGSTYTEQYQGAGP